MSAPETQIRSKVRGLQQGISSSKEGNPMRLEMGIRKAKGWLSASIATVTPWRVGRVLAMGALLSVGAALYFNMASGGEAGTPTSIEQMEVAPRLTDVDAVDNYLSVEDLLNYVYTEEPHQTRAAKPASTENFRVEPRFSDLDAVENYLSVDDLLKYVYAEEPIVMGSQIPYPDTPYYRDPDWNERQMRSSSN